jgi:hypothetical protein
MREQSSNHGRVSGNTADLATNAIFALLYFLLTLQQMHAFFCTSSARAFGPNSVQTNCLSFACGELVRDGFGNYERRQFVSRISRTLFKPEIGTISNISSFSISCFHKFGARYSWHAVFPLRQLDTR